MFLYLDNDLTVEEARTFLLPCIPLEDQKVVIDRCPQYDFWRSANLRAALQLYQRVAALGLDFLKVEPDIFIARAEFFDVLSQHEGRGFVGRVMPFVLPTSQRGRPVEFVQERDVGRLQVCQFAPSLQASVPRHVHHVRVLR